MPHHGFAAPQSKLLGDRLARAQTLPGRDDHGGCAEQGRDVVHVATRYRLALAGAIPYVLPKF
jgi:hypothetical protein